MFLIVIVIFGFKFSGLDRIFGSKILNKVKIGLEVWTFFFELKYGPIYTSNHDIYLNDKTHRIC